MAEAILTTQDLFNCPVCLDLLTDPVTIPCGHSFCRGCINDCWDQDDQKGSYSCPQCRHSFTPRPVLNKNTMLAELTDKLRKTKLQDVVPVDSSVGPGDVECDVCTERKRKAVKSCLTCLLSFCEAHVQNHYESPAYKKHKLIEASMNLQEKICAQHDRLLEVFCRRDKKLMCLLCMDSHTNHEVVSAKAERNAKQCSAQTAVEESEKLFTELIESVKKIQSQVKELIRAQEITELNHIEELVRNVEQEITDLRRRDAELEKLSLTDDDILFLQSFPSAVSVVPVDISIINTKPTFYLEFVKKIGTEFIGCVNKLNKLDLVKNTGQVHVISPWEPKTREEFLKYSCNLTLNPDTRRGELTISNHYKRASVTPQLYHGLKQQYQYEVICNEGLSERCYWEVEINGDVSVMLSYDNNWNIFANLGIGTSIKDRFWMLCSSVQSSRIGVYLDHKAGILAFYSVSNNIELLQKIYDKFTKPLYPRFCLKTNQSYVQLIDLDRAGNLQW
ncbi:E3 ubiquitin/ISG15 ligase TRIM25-like isoform X2 [Brachyhypopomus gauderio]|uniref:E3 ubiquitin/ISG15 ligase TRIM25-like isoform X2 n=1 Tax=Brachyhypopomus gauderio TaxID=698409 RepID=UPI0040411600